MTPEQALQNLNAAASLALLNRNDRITVEMSVTILEGILKNAKKTDAPDNSDNTGLPVESKSEGSKP